MHVCIFISIARENNRNFLTTKQLQYARISRLLGTANKSSVGHGETIVLLRDQEARDTHVPSIHEVTEKRYRDRKVIISSPVGKCGAKKPNLCATFF